MGVLIVSSHTQWNILLLLCPHCALLRSLGTACKQRRGWTSDLHLLHHVFFLHWILLFNQKVLEPHGFCGSLPLPFYTQRMKSECSVAEPGLEQHLSRSCEAHLWFCRWPAAPQMHTCVNLLLSDFQKTNFLLKSLGPVLLPPRHMAFKLPAVCVCVCFIFFWLPYWRQGFILPLLKRAGCS